MDREARIQAALQGLENGQYKSIRAAATAVDVPHNTLLYRKKGSQAMHQAHPHQQVCTEVEEKALIKWVQQWSSQGFPIRYEMLRNMARHLILDRLDWHNTISACLINPNWPAQFINQYPFLKGLITTPI